MLEFIRNREWIEDDEKNYAKNSICFDVLTVQKKESQTFQENIFKVVKMCLTISDKRKRTAKDI